MNYLRDFNLLKLYVMGLKLIGLILGIGHFLIFRKHQR